MLAGSGLGAIVLPVLAQAVITHMGWRSAYLTLGILAFVSAFHSRQLASRRPAAQQDQDVSTKLGSPSPSPCYACFWIIAATVCLYAISVNEPIRPSLRAAYRSRRLPAAPPARSPSSAPPA